MKASALAIALAASLLGAAPLAAQAVDPADTAAGAVQIHRLTPAQIEMARASAQERAADGVLDPGAPRDRAIHGEIGAAIGTGGTRAIFGTAAIPLGENGGAILSFEKARSNVRWR